MNLTPYKWPQGRVLRYVAGAVCLSYVGFGSYRFYVWLSDKTRLPFGLSETLPDSLRSVATPSVVGSVLLLIVGVIGTYLLVFAHAKVTDYLIAVEGEMRKVYWPKIKPWFSWSSELWGSTYVVIIVVVALSLFIKLVDLAFTPLYGLVFQ